MLSQSVNGSFFSAVLSLLCFMFGLTIFVCGFLLIQDERKLNRWVLSFLLMLIGLYFMSEGFILLGFKNFQLIQPAILAFMAVVGVVSTLLVRQHIKDKEEKIRERVIDTKIGKLK